MPTNTEATINAKLAECLRSKHPGWMIGAEQTKVFVEKMKKPDIVVSREGGLTVVVETEYAPANTVEADAQTRLGQTIKLTGEKVEQCVAVRLPASLRQVEQRNLDCEVRAARYFFAVFTYESKEELFDHVERWPESGWLEGGLDDLAGCIETVALSERRVAKGVRILESGVRETAGHLQYNAPQYILARLALKLHQEAGEQTNRMATAILANAVIFHMRLARLHPEIEELGSCKAGSGAFLKRNVLDCWQAILDINYWPIFQLASDLLRILPEREAQKVIGRLDGMAAELEHFGAADIQDLSGRMFQQLITDRKFLATFYTLPASATLLAELAVFRLAVDWAVPERVTALRLADLACGTGALLGASYHAIASRHRRTGGHDDTLHAKMMEDVLTAADIMPSAVHLTAATLSGMHPDKTFGHTRVINMPYGEKGEGVSIGSLDLVQADETRALFGTGRKVLTGKGVVGDDSEAAVLEVPHGSMDLVIMNPPFTRPTNHETTGVPVPSFAGFRTKEQEQAKMSVRLKEIKAGLVNPASHGNAGLASNFIDLAHAKVRPGGILALILPASFAQGNAWANARALFKQYYHDILIVSIATDGSTDRAFSADTGMAEVLLVATRKNSKGGSTNDICVVNLLRRPKTQLEAAATARAIEESRLDSNEEAGNVRLTETEKAGNFFRSDDWVGVGVRGAAVAILMKSLSQGTLLLPRMRESIPVPVCKLDNLGRRGFLHRDINGLTSSGKARGPFDLEGLTGFGPPEYPILWGHDASRERQLIVAPDRQGISRAGCRERAALLWRDGASRLHFNLDFQINSQPLAACLTEKPALGGRAWPNFITSEYRWEIPIILWANTTLGLISFWWGGTRQHQGRAMLTITRLPQLLSIDAAKLTEEQLDLSDKIFDDFRGQDFLPANEAYRDDVRKALDRAVLVDLLGVEDNLLDNLTILREQWCAEPSVHGGKATKPRP